jgi:ketosteroid isomerase-like protein
MNVTALEQRTGSAAFDHQNAELVQTLYRALRARDLEAAAELIYPDFVAHVPGKGINAGEYWSVEGFKTSFRTYSHTTAGTSTSASQSFR